jgi:hypothetical protein
MQIKKSEIGKVFKKLKLDVRSTKHRYGWFVFEGRKILRVHYSHGNPNKIFASEYQIALPKEKDLAEELAKTRKLLESRKFTGKKEATKLNMQYWI